MFKPRPRIESNQVEDLRVNDLINFESKTWRHDVIDGLFLEADSCKIQCLPLPITPRRDSLIWNADRMGRFSVRSGYYVARKLLGREGNVGEEQAKCWKAIWGRRFTRKLNFSCGDW
ncbi:hypothetical protein COLO4_16566 [Corchorus olitorius]|uniref:Uncharacterized protein n=1 Tax=Corchorus olitorius TaxID=93759 RepID=A0A1R3JGR9_9ROSI|nr:hypothetical protein COLO4_16566 [Corchorus olitorius]